MANEGAAGQRGGSPATEHDRPDDFEVHARDYSGFIKMFKYLAIVSFVTAIFVMFIIS